MTRIYKVLVAVTLAAGLVAYNWQPSFKNHRVDYSRMHQKVAGVVRDKKLMNEYQLGVIVFAPVHGAFAYARDDKMHRSSFQKERLIPDFDWSKHELKPNGAVEFVFGKVKYWKDTKLSDAVEMTDNETAKCVIPLKRGTELELLKPKFDARMCLEVLDDNPEQPVFALGFKKPSLNQE